MVGIVRIDRRGIQRVKTIFGRVGRWPKFTRKAMMEWGKVLERDTKNVARSSAKIRDFTGNLQNKGIRWEQKPNGDIGVLRIAEYGVQLDRMKRHGVAIRKSRPHLLRWARQAQHPTIRQGANAVASGRARQYAIGVKSHPFINKGFRRARPKLRAIIKKNLKLK